jgi:uncharacterized protein YuzE
LGWITAERNGKAAGLKASPALHPIIHTAITTQHLVEGIAVDCAADGRMAGIEILDAGKRLGEAEVFRRVVLEDVALDKPAPSA